jgi:hypothetical protein
MSAETERLRTLADTYAAYVEFLNEANESPISLAFVHGWRCPDEDIRRGREFRERIAELGGTA